MATPGNASAGRDTAEAKPSSEKHIDPPTTTEESNSRSPCRSSAADTALDDYQQVHYDALGAPTSQGGSPGEFEPDDHLQPRDNDEGFEGDGWSDSGIESDRESLWTSLNSEARNFTFENGRRYHAFREGRYFHPNDEQESNREDMKHHLTLLLFRGELHHAPIGSHPHRILDVGTGTGIWAMDCADTYPSAEVVGIDLSPIQPQMTPPNLQFEIDDAESEWLWPEDHFDLIHVRYMFSAIADWPRLLAQARTALKPGGWIEVTEMDILPTSDDGTVQSDYKLIEYFNILKRAASGRGVDFDVAPKLKSLLRDAGITDVVENVFKLPLGPWAQDKDLRAAGLYHREQFLDGLQGIILKYLTVVEGWRAERVEVFLAGVRAQIKDRNIHCYWKIYNVYGQK